MRGLRRARITGLIQGTRRELDMGERKDEREGEGERERGTRNGGPDRASLEVAPTSQRSGFESTPVNA